MKISIVEFLGKFGPAELEAAGVLSQERRILTGASVKGLIELMRSAGVGELFYGVEWRLSASGEFRNGFCEPPVSGNVNGLESASIVFKGTNRVINPFYDGGAGRASVPARTTGLACAGEMSGMLDSLPLNRKEVHWTACVLPQIICGDGFERLHRFLRAAGVPERFVRERYSNGEIQFVAEYSIRESALDWPETRRFGGFTPDLVIFLSAGFERHLVFVEGKMFDYVVAGALGRQLHNQRGVAEAILDRNGIPRNEFTHVALLLDEPREAIADNDERGAPIMAKKIFWRELLEIYGDLAGSYFYEMLRVACANPQLVTTEEAYRMRMKA